MTKETRVRTWKATPMKDWGNVWVRLGNSMVKISKKEETFKDDGKITVTLVQRRKKS